MRKPPLGSKIPVPSSRKIVAIDDNNNIKTTSKKRLKSARTYGFLKESKQNPQN